MPRISYPGLGTQSAVVASYWSIGFWAAGDAVPYRVQARTRTPASQSGRAAIVTIAE